MTTTSNGLPKPDELSGVGSGEGALVVLDGLDDALVGGEDCSNGMVVSCVPGASVGEGPEVDDSVSVSGSSVCVVEAEVVVDEGRTVVKVSAGLLEVVRVTVVGAAVELLLGVDTGVSGVLPGQTSATRLPNKTCPSTVPESALTS